MSAADVSDIERVAVLRDRLAARGYGLSQPYFFDGSLWAVVSLGSWSDELQGVEEIEQFAERAGCTA